MATNKNVLVNTLKNDILNVVFTKSDGTERTMKCTLKEDFLPAIQSASVKSKVRNNPDVLAVWDIDNNGWRSFRMDSILEVYK